MAKKKGEQIKPEVLEELSAAEKEISAPEEGIEAEKVETDVLEELATAEKEMMAEVPELAEFRAEKGFNTAKYLLTDYYFTSTSRILWAYIDQKGWKHRYISNTQVAGIAKVAFESYRVDVSWQDKVINMIRCWKKF
ncbi:MAG: hypothetical protein BA863_07790 [Desulfovibrio sp. S3730MH75]|nr:MAG: hypothetical protein BA863_07790 [Desulfovibrio sp. S3730MH75]